MKAPASLEMLDAEVQVDDQRHMQHAVLALLTLAALKADDISDHPGPDFGLRIDGQDAVFKVTDVLVENNGVKVVIATGDDSSRGKTALRAVMIIDNEPVQKLFIYDGNIPLREISIAAFNNLLAGA